MTLQQRDPERLVSFAPLSYPDYQDVRTSGIFENLAAGNQCYPALRWRVGDSTRQVIADCLSADFFDVVGGTAALGRTFSSIEAAPEKNPRIVVIGYRFWQRQLAADPNVIGRILTLDNTQFTVIGVLPGSYRAIQGYGIDPDIFIPFNTVLQPGLFDRRPSVFDMMKPIGRLAAGRTREQTQQALNRVLREMALKDPQQTAQSHAAPSLIPVVGLAKYGDSQADRSILLFSVVLSGVATLVLLIGCTNVAGLLLARGVARRREIAVRLAIGAGRVQLVRQLLIEVAIVALLGTAAGVGITFWAAILLTRIDVPEQDVTVRFAFSPDWRFAGVIAALGVFVTLASGLAPAFASSRSEIANTLRVSKNAMAPRLRLRSFLVTAQVAISVVLLSGAFLLLHNVFKVLRSNPGFDIAHTVWLDFATDRKQPIADQRANTERLYQALENYPGVESVSWAWYLPFQLVYAQRTIQKGTASAGPGVSVIEQGIGPDYLKTMRIPILAGREFEMRDRALSNPRMPSPVVINEALARALFKGQNPVGERLVGTVPPGGRPMMVIGVAANTAFRSPAEEPVPLLQSLSVSTSSFIVRVAGPATSVAPNLSGVIERNAPGTGSGYFTMLERFQRATWPARAATLLLGVLAAIGLTLALIGLCGMSIYNSARRTQELGIRMALGATRGQVMRLMLRDGLTLVGVGAAIGVLLALGLTRFIAAFLTAGLSPSDPITYVAIIAILALTAAAAIWLPCWRAARTDPVESLRME